MIRTLALGWGLHGLYLALCIILCNRMVLPLTRKWSPAIPLLKTSSLFFLLSALSREVYCCALCSRPSIPVLRLQVGSLPIEWGRMLVPLVVEGKVRLTGQCLRCPEYLNICDKILLIMR